MADPAHVNRGPGRAGSHLPSHLASKGESTVLFRPSQSCPGTQGGCGFSEGKPKFLLGSDADMPNGHEHSTSAYCTVHTRVWAPGRQLCSHIVALG